MTKTCKGRCHCRWCPRETGALFALNTMIDSDRVTPFGAEPELVHTPTDSGLGQKIARRPVCRVAVRSHYAGSGPVTSFVREGALDNPDLLPPDSLARRQALLPVIEAYQASIRR